MYNKIVLSLFLLISGVGLAQTVTEIPLYPGTVPGSKQSSIKEQVFFNNGAARIASVITPILTKYTPAKANGVSVIICPGGSYIRLSIDLEGAEVARAFN